MTSTIENLDASITKVEKHKIDVGDDDERAHGGGQRFVTVVVGLICGTLIGSLHGWLIAYRGIPSFIVTLGGLMVWRGMAFLSADGRTISPVDETFALLGGGPSGSIGAMGSWAVGLLGCAAVLWILRSGRASRRTHGFALRPMWAEYTMVIINCGVILIATLVVNSYGWPKGILKDYYASLGQEVPEGAFIAHGFAIPVLILAAVTIAMTILMTRTRFGRYVFAIGGNPEAATLSERLIGAGRDGATPALIVVEASRPGEQRVKTTLAQLASAAEHLSGPALLIIGEAMALAEVSATETAIETFLEAAR